MDSYHVLSTIEDGRSPFSGKGVDESIMIDDRLEFGINYYLVLLYLIFVRRRYVA